MQFIIPRKYSSPTPHNGDGQSVQRHYLIPSIQFNLQNQFCPTEISFLNSSFISCSFIVILQHPQVFISIFFCLSIFSPLGNSISSVDLTFTLFIIITPLFNTKKYAYALTKDLYSRNRPFDFIFLFPYSIKSSINRRWLIFSTPLPNVYLASALHSSWVSDIMHTTNNKGDKLSPYEIPVLMITFAKLSPYQVNCICQFAISHLIPRFVCLFLQSHSIVLSINNWSLVPLVFFLHSFCWTGSLSFTSRKL